MQALRLEHASVRVPDLDPALAYYCGALGLHEQESSDGIRYLGCGGDPGFDLSLAEGGVGLDHFALTLGSARDLDQAERELNAAGVETTRTEAAEPGIQEAVRFRMPTGHEVELVVRTRQFGYLHPADWHREAIHAPVGINHVTLMCEDVRAVADFLVQKLNFRVSDVFEPEPDQWAAAFLRVGENHHDVALLGGPQSWLHHVAFAATDISALLGFCDRLARLGYHAEYGVGRHGPGGNVFLYMLDPAGNRVELTCDVARVPDRDAPVRFWRGDFLSILNVWAPIQPPESFGSGT